MSIPEDTAPNRDNRPLNLVRDFSKANIGEQWGWQMVDDTTVLERKMIPLFFYSNSDAQRWAAMVTVYDFNAFQTVTYVQHAYDSEAKTPQVFRTHFSEVEGKQSIRDAHRALTGLGGHPPPLEEIMGYLTELQRNVSISTPLKFKPGQS